VLNVSDWSVFAYKSQHPKTSEFPLGTILSVSDGPLGKGKGTPYMYVSEVEEAVQDTDVSSSSSSSSSSRSLSYTVEAHLNITV
jgi:hypothetical protein